MVDKFNVFLEGLDSEKRLNWIIDKMSRLGKSSLSKSELDYLETYQEGKPIEVPSSEHYNKYIVALLNDVKNKNITDKIAKTFIEKHVSKDDLSEFLLSLLKDGKLNFLTDIHNITEKQEQSKEKRKLYDTEIIKKDNIKRKKLKYIKIPNFIKY